MTKDEEREIAYGEAPMVASDEFKRLFAHIGCYAMYLYGNRAHDRHRAEQEGKDAEPCDPLSIALRAVDECMAGMTEAEESIVLGYYEPQGTPVARDAALFRLTLGIRDVVEAYREALGESGEGE